MAILLDRLLGLSTMLILGGLAALSLLIQGGKSMRAAPTVPLLCAISLAFGTAILAAPLLSKALMPRIQALFHKAGAKEKTPELGTNLRKKNFIPRVMRQILMLQDTLESSTGHRGWAVIPLLISAGIAIINPISFYLSALAIGRPIPFLIILAAAPFAYIAVFLPLGFAGYGGQQLVVAGVFALFRVDPETVIATSFLQTTIVLAVQTFLGGVGAVLSLDRLRAVFKNL
jgi:uncharacterized membrane protein YbhN (UPF0104 family)